MSKWLRTLLFAVLTVAPACALSGEMASGEHVSLDEVKTKMATLNGRMIHTEGFLLMNERSTNIVSNLSVDANQICIGILVTDDEYARLRQYDRMWVDLVGKLNANRCVGNELCQYSCGPAVLTDITIVRNGMHG